MLRVLAASTALVACGAHAQYGGGSGRPVMGLPPSVELNLDVLTKLRPPPAQEMRKVPSEQPYTPPMRLPAMQPVGSSVVARPLPTAPFAKGESGANILSDVSSVNYKPEVKKPAPRPAAPRPVAVKAPAPAPVAAPAPAPIPAPAPAPAAPAPVSAPAPVMPMVVPPAAPAPVTNAQPTSVVPPVNNAPMMIPVKPKTAPVPMLPKEVPVEPAPITAPAKPALPAPIPTGVVPPAAAPAAVNAPAPIIPPAPAPAAMTPPAPMMKPTPKPAEPLGAVPSLAPVPMAAKPSLNVPAPPSLDGLDFSNMKDDGDGLGDLTPQKLLGKPVETMVVAKPSTLPEIEVPAATMTEKLPTVVKEKPTDGMLPSISNRVDKLFTKDDVKMGMQSDTTRVINPVAEKQKELAAKAAAEKAALPKLPEAGGLPPLPPLETAPKEKSVTIADAKPEKKVAIAGGLPVGLPSLDAITGTKPPTSSMDIIQPKDGIIATEKMPPATLPEPIAALPVVKKEAAPKVVVEDKKPTPPAPLPMPTPLPQVKKEEAPKPPASPLAIMPKEKPNIKEETKIAALPPLPDFGANTKKPDPALAPALPQLPPPTKPEAKKPEPVKAEPVKAAPMKAPEVEVQAPASVTPKPPSGGSGKPSASVGFTKDATDLSPAAKSQLMGIADRIKKDDASVRIVAYAQGTEDEASVARRISLSRALQVRAFLIDKGVNQLKINVQALGHKVPSGNADRADVVVY